MICRRATGIRVVLSVIVVVVAWWVRPVQFGGTTSLVVVSGSSMEPTYHTGDVLVVREAVADEGDVIVFHVPGREGQIVHRVVERRDDGTLLVQGDNRSSPDLPLPTDADVIGVAVLLLPRAWWVVYLLSSPLVLGVAAGSWVLAHLVRTHQRDHWRASITHPLPGR